MKTINELIEQIGGRDKIEVIATYSGKYDLSTPAKDVALMARALLAVLDAQSKPAAWISSGEFEILGRLKKHTAVEVGLFNSQRFDNDTPLFVTPPAASVPDGLVTAVNLLLDSDGSRGTFSAIRRGDALAEVERLLAAAPAPGGK